MNTFDASLFSASLAVSFLFLFRWNSSRLNGDANSDFATVVNFYGPPAEPRPFPAPFHAPSITAEKQFALSVADLMESAPLHAGEAGSSGGRRTRRLIKGRSFMNATIILPWGVGGVGGEGGSRHLLSYNG